MDVVVGGGGIIGLSAALELARGGLRVQVVEQGRAMTEASWAAAGMLAAEDPENPGALAQLAALSRELYPKYLDVVEGLSGCSVPIRTRSTLQASEPGGGFRCTETGTRWRVTAKEAEERVGALSAGGRSFLWLEEMSLDPRDLCASLPAAAIATGVALQENTKILSVEAGNRSVRITTSAGEVQAGAFLNCCGAWASAIRYSSSSNDTVHFHIESVEPRKGQMLAVRVDGSLPLHHVIRAPEIYLVPRGDGRIVIGASVERAGFSREVERKAIDKLLTQAADLWPPILSSMVIESWAGLRPGTKDDLPLIGSAGLSNCWLATGHFRNGILLAPATARVVCQLLRGEEPEVSLDTFALERAAIR